VTGIPRLREWDGFAVVELPELAGWPDEFELLVPVDGPPAVQAAASAPPEAVERITNALDAQIDRPYEAYAVRQDAGHFAVGARRQPSGDAIDLPEDLPATELQVVRAPDGEFETSADGEPIDPADQELYEPALAMLERRGRARFESFVARADKAEGGRWRVTVDPL
jgi:hypothetical protein